MPVPSLLINKDTGLIASLSLSAQELGYEAGQKLPIDCLELAKNPNAKTEIERHGRYWNLNVSDTSQGLWVIATETTKLHDENQKIVAKLNDNQSFMAHLLYHDLTPPLATIAYLLKKGDEKSLEKAKGSVVRVMSLVERSGFLFGKGGGHKEKIKAVDMIRDVIDDLELSINNAQAQIDVIGNGTVIYGEVVRLREVFQNLIGNALKFKSPVRELHITVTVIKLEKITSIEVKDNGIGIPEMFFEEIFAPTKKLHSRARFEGEGLGLAIAKQIVEEHLGKITISSELDVGTSFTVWLPYYDDTPTTPN